jgi:alpha-tubulin suppressor-like RCC1 family protein
MVKSRITCAVTIALAVQACSPTNRIEWNEVAQVEQPVASCGTSNVCAEYNACTSWDLNTAGDGLGFTIAPPTRENTGLSWSMQCQCQDCGNDDQCTSEPDPCPGQATSRRSSLLASRPGMPLALRNGLMVTPDNVQTSYHESIGCRGRLQQDDDEQNIGVCVQTWTFRCELAISNLANPATFPRPACQCLRFAPLDCLPGGTVVTAGLKHSCAVVNEGAQCWGGNDVGQLGDGSTADFKFQRVPVSGLGAGVAVIAAGASHNCAIVGGDVHCWGDNTHGQLGKDLPNGATLSRVPVKILNMPNVQAIAGGNAHTCAVVNGGAKCWGNNDFGELGNSSNTESHTPVSVTGLASGVQAVTAGGQHSCAIVNGAAKCWGHNGDGQLGAVTQTPDGSNQPVQVNGLTSGVTAIVAGVNHTCALVNGGVKCWGSNSSGQLGNGTTNPVSVGTLVSISSLASGVTGIVAGQNHTCAIASGGAARCWGANNQGQLGSDPNDSSPHPSPTQLPALTGGVRTLYTGYDHSCAVANGGLQCWGSNQNGQLAQDPDNGSQSPTPIAIGGVVCGLKDGVVKCFPAGGCQDGTIEQTFDGGMVGCSGGTTYDTRGTYCAAGYQSATAADWVARRGAAVPSHDYWVNDQLRYNGNAGACFVSTTVGTNCGSTTPMRVCTTARDMTGRDSDGNSCNWINCGINTLTPNQYFGGCSGNTTAGTLCVPAL